MYRRHFLFFGGLSVILAIPGAALTGYSVFALFGGLINSLGSDQPFDIASIGPSLVIIGFAVLVNLLLLPFTQGAVVYAACESALGRPITVLGVLGGVARTYLPTFGYLFLVWLMYFLFCLLPLWIWIWVGWVAVLPIMYIEKTGLVPAMGRSWRLVEGRWWRTFLIFLLMVVLWYLVRLALSGVTYVASQLLLIVFGNFLVTAVISAVSEVLYALASPILQIGIVLIYFDLRVRREGLDLFQLAQRLTATQLPA